MYYIFVVGRILFGLYFAFAGFNHYKNRAMLEGYTASKGVPYPKAANAVAGALLLLGGLGILFDVFWRISMVLILIFLVPATFMIHDFWKDKDPQAKQANMTHFLKNVGLIGATLMLFVL